MRGRKPTPTTLRVIHGNPGKRAMPKHEPIPPGDLTEPPDWYDDVHRAVWREAIDAAPLGLLRRLDASVLNVWVCACVAHQRATRTQSLLDATTDRPLLTLKPDGTEVESPYLRIARQQGALMIKAAAEMGFTPSSRTRVQLEKTKEPTGKGAARFFT